MRPVEKNVVAEKLSANEKAAVGLVQKLWSTIHVLWVVAKHGHGRRLTIPLVKFVVEIELSQKAVRYVRLFYNDGNEQALILV